MPRMTERFRPRARSATGLAALLLSLPAMAALDKTDLAAARELRDRALKSPLAYELAASLTTEVGPRLAGTAGDRAAVAWATRQFERLGLQNVTRMDVVVPRWVRGTAALAIVEPFAQTLAAVALGGSIGTHDEGVTAEAIRVDDLEALAALPADAVAGRIVYFSQRTERTDDGSGYGRAVRVRTGGPAAAAGKGAVAVVIRSIGTSSNRLPHTGTTVYSIGQPRIPAVAISNPDADLLERQFDGGKPVRLALESTARDLPQVQSANVIAEVPGTDRAEEIVLLGAHLDSWDLGTGALDNAAGVSIVMAAAHLIGQTQPRPRRTVRVVLFANEEFGVSGSREYLARMEDQLGRHAVAMEADLGAGPVLRLDSRVAPESLPLVRQIHSVLRPLGIPLGDNTATGGADIRPLRDRGVPVLGPRLDATLYFDHHHTANDTLDKIDPAHLAQSTAVFAVAAYLAARADEPWPHLPPPENAR